MSILVFLHIRDKKKLFEICSNYLQVGRCITFEDYFVEGLLSTDEKRILKEEVSSEELFTLEEYDEIMQEAGFRRVGFECLTKEYRKFVKDRHKAHKSWPFKKKIAKKAFDSLGHFKMIINELFNGEDTLGGLRGGRFVYQKIA